MNSPDYSPDFILVRHAVFEYFIQPGAPITEEELTPQDVCDFIAEMGWGYSRLRDNEQFLKKELAKARSYNLGAAAQRNFQDGLVPTTNKGA